MTRLPILAVAFVLITVLVIASCAKNHPDVGSETRHASAPLQEHANQAKESTEAVCRQPEQSAAVSETSSPTGSKSSPPASCVVRMVMQPSQMPAEWFDPRYAPLETLFIQARDYPKWEAFLCGALDKYPQGIVDHNISSVSPLAKLVIGGASLGGTSAGNRVFIVVNKRNMAPQVTSTVESTLHQNIASVFAYNHPKCIAWNEWDKLLPGGFLRTGWDGATGKSKLSTSDALKEAGFLVSYATSTAELDFGVYVSRLMCGDSNIWEDAKRYPRVHSKIELAIKMLNCIDARFDEKYFRNLITRSETGSIERQ